MPAETEADRKVVTIFGIKVPMPHVTLMPGWLFVIVVLFAFVYFNSPQQLPVIAYKLLLVTLAAYVAHKLDKTFFRNKDTEGHEGEIARALVFVGVVLGLTIGV